MRMHDKVLVYIRRPSKFYFILSIVEEYEAIIHKEVERATDTRLEILRIGCNSQQTGCLLKHEMKHLSCDGGLLK